MGYDTSFEGAFTFNRELDDKSYETLRDGHGVDGELYLKDDLWHVVDKDEPPRTQPSLYLQWIPTEDRKQLKWDGIEKFYGFVQWLEYLLDEILQPVGYSLSGVVTWEGEDPSDTGTITCSAEHGVEVEGSDLGAGFAYVLNLSDTCSKHGEDVDTDENCNGRVRARTYRQTCTDLDAYYDGLEDEHARKRLEACTES